MTRPIQDTRPRALLLMPALAAALACPLLAASPAGAEEDEPEARQMTQEEIEAWLDAKGTKGTRDIGATDAPAEVPPPPPRRRGLVIQSLVGGFQHLGPLKNVTPISPWFHLQVGYEFFKILMPFVEADVTFANTSYASPPPEPRAFAYYGAGAGLRVSFDITDRVGVFVQGDIGMARASEDVLRVYGYDQADEFNPYFGAMLGVDWFQVNPHYALVITGGVRDYQQGFERQRSTQTPLVVVAGLALRYAF